MPAVASGNDVAHRRHAVHVADALLEVPDLAVFRGHARAESNVATGDIVVYFTNDGDVVHAGRVYGDLVRSKWAAGHLWDHGVLELPIGYGSMVRFYAPSPPPEDVLDLLVRFAEADPEVRYPGLRNLRTGIKRGDNSTETTK